MLKGPGRQSYTKIGINYENNIVHLIYMAYNNTYTCDLFESLLLGHASTSNKMLRRVYDNYRQFT